MSKIFKSTLGTDYVLHDMGAMVIPAGGQLAIDPASYSLLARSTNAVQALFVDGIVYNDGTNDLNVSEALDHIRGYYPKHVKYEAFAEKKTKEGESIFARTEGVTSSLILGVNSILFTIPYTKAKFNEIEIIGGEKGDKANLKIQDDASGTFTGIPFYPLNQFGKNVAVSKDFYVRKSNYDADLLLGMNIALEYTSISAKDIEINYVIHEVKP